MPKLKSGVIGLLVLITLALSPGLTAAAPMALFPEVIPLPNGFQPEGIVAGRGTTLYAGSLANGAIYQADARTGQGAILVTPPAGRVAVGLAFDERTGYLYVAGGPTGSAYVYDGATGATVGVFALAPTTTTFVNDVIVTRNAAYFTDSFRPVLYRLPLSRSGQLPGPGVVEELSLGGEFVFVPGNFNSNGIEAAPNGEALFVINSAASSLYRVDPDTGVASLLATVPSGDGLLLEGRLLYVVQNFLNQIAVVQLSAGWTSGTVVQVLTDETFDIPTTVTRIRASLYAVNARFSTPPGPDTEYWISKVSP
jgi:sugar lactone lactonase YvrE